MIETTKHVWTLTEEKDASLGLSCSEDGLFLGHTPLLERQNDRLIARPKEDLERILDRGFGSDAALSLDRVVPGLRAVSSALNENNLCRARIAAVHLRIPELPDALARLAMETEDLLIKLEQRGHALRRADAEWEEEHPRTGTAPNPGWFAPKDGGSESAEQVAEAEEDKPLRLPPGERNDEIGDLLEWIANAKPEDVEAISGEISRLFYQYGDFADGAALHQALLEVLENPDRANRQRILDQYEFITHHDPTAEGAVTAEIGIITGLRTPGGGGPKIPAPAVEAAEAAADVWKLGWATRGRTIEIALGKELGEKLPDNFPVIDYFPNGIATSIKSIDLNAATYQNAQRLSRRINTYVDQLAQFSGKMWAGREVASSAIVGRELNVAIPKGSVTATQRAAMDAAIERAKARGVVLKFTPF